MSEAPKLSRRSVLLGAADATATAPATSSGGVRVPLWKQGRRRGIAYGSSTATWQLADEQYARLFAREAGTLFTEDDLLRYRLKPTPDSPLDRRRAPWRRPLWPIER
jgi:endo-1,4-beta-xylanase